MVVVGLSGRATPPQQQGIPLTKTARIPIVLADLVHGGHNVKNFPYGIACLAAHALAETDGRYAFELYRDPDELGRRLAGSPPAIVGFSNYLWNANVSYDFIRQLKRERPDVVVIMGGPDYPLQVDEQVGFLGDRPLVDFYVDKEGEVAFVGLLDALAEFDYDAARLKADGRALPGVHYLVEGRAVFGEPAEKIRDMDALPSPYLTGLLDKFFAQGYDPLMQFKRGCPFSCSFCGEGDGYYNKVGKASIGRFVDELEYCAQRVDPGATLYLADANFGMYKDDVDLCQEIGRIQDQYGWPTSINASTGKNQVERVRAAMTHVQGALRLGAALQSIDPVVLDNINRSNISPEKLIAIAEDVRSHGHNSYAEVILGLPGETVESHLQTLKTAVDGGIKRIQMYPLTVLRDSEMATPEYRRTHGIETKYRLLPRCFGTYHYGAETIPAAEISEMVVSTGTMSFDEYLYCKQFQLTVELFYNDGYLEEAFGLIRFLGLSVFDYIRACHDLFHEFPADLRAIYDGLTKLVRGELFETRLGAEQFAKQPGALAAYAADEHKNSLATNRAVAIVAHTQAIHDMARKGMLRYLDAQGIDDAHLRGYIDEALRFSLLRKTRILEADFAPTETFHYRFEELDQRHFVDDPAAFRTDRPVAIKFWHTPDQAADIADRYNSYDDPVMGMRNLIYYSMTASAADYFRKYASGS